MPSRTARPRSSAPRRRRARRGYLNARGLLVALCAAMLVGAAVVGSQRIRRDLAPGTGEAVARLECLSDAMAERLDACTPERLGTPEHP